MPLVKIDSISYVTREVLKKCGVPGKSIDIILKTILYANRRGVPTHGVGRLPLYIKKIKAGTFNPFDEVEVINCADAIAVLDAHGTFGQVAAEHAMEICMRNAKKYGIAAVGVRNSNNFGAAGYFGEMAAKKGMAAIIFANASPAIAPTGGHKTIFGTNPLCYAFPAGATGDAVILDMATTVVARGKIRQAEKNGEKIPDTWATDKSGNPTDDPSEALKGALLPIAGYKGYGLSLFVDLFAGLLTGSAYAGEVRPLSDMASDSRNGHLFIVLDVKRYMTEAELEERMSSFKRKVKDCGDEGKVLLPGERGYKMAAEQYGAVKIPQKQVEEVNKIADDMGIDYRLEVIENESK